MAATNFTPIILYHSVTASAAPSAGNLNNGELAINITDGKLFYKDNGGVVQIIATKGTAVIGGSNNQVQYNSSGALAGSSNFTFDGTTATINTLNLTTVLDETYGGTGLTSYTTGDVIYASGSNTLAKLAIGANTYILTSTGSVPQWSAPSAVSVSTATNLAGGTAGAVPYQSGAGSTTFLSIGTLNQVLTSTGSAPQWSSGLTLTTLATTGNTTLGDAAADNLTINATVTSNLIFTDNTYDIGANGATRPRTIYVGTSVFSPLVDATNLEVTNIKALDGTAAASIANSTGAITVSTLLNVDNLRLDGNTLSSTNTNGAINLTPNGTGQVTITNDALINTVRVGLGAGAVATNTAVGVSALNSNTTGARLVAVGANSLFANTTGSYSVAVGNDALRFATTGSNVAIGDSALYSNTTGSSNVAIGTYNGSILPALYSNVTGSQNVAIGTGALQANTNASNNTAVGYQAGYSNTTGIYLVAVGYRAAYSNTSGLASTAIGHSALRLNTFGDDNTAVGFVALENNTTGARNSAFGSNALTSNTTGSNNTAVGLQALASNTTASNNTAVGYQAAYTNTFGDGLTAVGFKALFSNTTGVANTAVGGLYTGLYNPALFSNTIGVANSAFAPGALASNTSGSNNTALGVAALFSNTTASNNTAVGFQAGYGITTGQYNTAIGALTASAACTGSFNALFGQASGNALTSGSYNTFLGSGGPGIYGAGQSTTTGSYNVAVGSQSLGLNTGGVENTALGYAALYRNTTGNYNVAVGKEALVFNTFASYNTAVGYQAAYTNVTGQRLVAVGQEALYSTTAGFNVAIGAAALRANTTGVGNIAIGTYYDGVVESPLFSNTTGQNNIAVGMGALRANTFGNSNLAVGFKAMQNNTIGSNNVALGEGALVTNTTASNNTAVGFQALYSNVSTFNSTAVGYQAAYANTAAQTTAIGAYALNANTTGVSNTAVGTAAAFANTWGGYNSVLGDNALYYNTTGSYNTAVGRQALAINTWGSYNTAIGYQAGYNNITGVGNTFLGTQAGFSHNVTGNTYSTYIGYYSGFSTTGVSNTFVGEESGYLITSGGKNTILGRYNGNQSGLDIRTASNYIVLSDGDGNPRINVDNSGNTAIATAPSNARLLVSGGSLPSAGGLSMSSLLSAGRLATGNTNNTTGLVNVFNDNGVLELSAGTTSAAFAPAGIVISADGAATQSSTIRFFTYATQRGMFTSGGYLLVGCNDLLAYNPGIRLGPTNYSVTHTSSTSTDYLGYFNRESSDGEALRFGRGNTGVGTISVTTTATAYNTSSDYRLKNNPQPLTNSGVFIDALKPKTWEWKADGSKGVGFIAHEVQEVSPNSVVGEKDAVDADGKPVMQVMEYGSAEFIANIVAELQSLRARVAALEGK